MRGQTLPDFAVGIAIFLLTITFISLFIPQMTLPYENQEQTVVVQRAASDLGNHMLADGQTPSRLDRTCTLAFFDLHADDGCAFDAADPLTDQLGIASTYDVNVTLRNASSDVPNSSLLCVSTGSIVSDCGSGDSPLATGPPVPEGDRSVSLARQRVFVGQVEAEAVLEVWVW